MNTTDRWEKVAFFIGSLIPVLLHWLGFAKTLAVLVIGAVVFAALMTRWLAKGNVKLPAQPQFSPLDPLALGTDGISLQALDGFGARVEPLGFRPVSPWISRVKEIAKGFKASDTVGIWQSPSTNDIAILYKRKDGRRAEFRRRDSTGRWIMTAASSSLLDPEATDSPDEVRGVGDYDPRDLWLAHQEHCALRGTKGVPVEFSDAAAFLARLDLEDEASDKSSTAPKPPKLRELIARGRRNAGLSKS